MRHDAVSEMADTGGIAPHPPQENRMRLRVLPSLVLAAALAAGIGAACAQAFAIEWNPRSGDAWVDAWLGDINRYGVRYREPFIDEMVRYHGAPRGLVVELLGQRHWAPGDVYYACAIARVAALPCAQVVDAWTTEHAQGWGVLAKRLGIAPGSVEFDRLKRGFVPTYDRWARPIELDAALQRAYPDHGKGKP